MALGLTKLIKLTLGGLFLASLSFAQSPILGEYQGNCEQGNTKVVTAATNSTSKVMGSFPLCTVAIYITNSSPATLANLYTSSTGVTPKANPFTANSDGSFQFFSDSPVVDIQKSGGGIPTPFTLGNQIISFPPEFVVDAAYTTLARACTAAGTGQLIGTRSWPALPTQTLSCNILALAGFIIQPDTGQTITLAGTFDGSLTKHFDESLGSITSTTPFKTPVLYPQWFGTTGNGRTVSDGSCAATSHTVVSASAAFTSADVGRYLSISGAGAHTTFPNTYNGGLGTTISSVSSATTVIIAGTCVATVSGATVTVGTNDYTALRNTAAAASWSGVGSVVFPQGMYVIGQHATATDSCTNSAESIFWALNKITISGYGATIYLDGSFSQTANCSGSKSAANEITPFYVMAGSVNYVIEGFTILGNKDLTTRASGVTSEGLTSFGISDGAGNHDYTVRDVTASGMQTDCFQLGSAHNTIEKNILYSNVTCSQPARGNFGMENAVNVHLSGVHGGNAGQGNYGGYNPYFCIGIEPDQVYGSLQANAIVIDNSSSCENDIGWELYSASSINVGYVTIRDSTFSWSNANKQQGFNCNSLNCEIDHNTFNVGVAASANNVLAFQGVHAWQPLTSYPGGQFALDNAGHFQSSGGGTSGASTPAWNDSGGTTSDGSITWTDQGLVGISQLWHNNTFIDTTNGVLNGGNGAIFDSTGNPDGTPNALDIINNTFLLNGLALEPRNARNFNSNYVFWKTTGSESSGANERVSHEGAVNTLNNIYQTNLTAAGKSITVHYTNEATGSIANEIYTTPIFMTSACSFCVNSTAPSGATVTSLPVTAFPNLILNSGFTGTGYPWVFQTHWALGSGVATATNADSGDSVTQLVNGIVAGNIYYLQYTTSGYSGSGQVITIAGGGLQAGGHAGNGTWVDPFVALASGAQGVGVAVVAGSTNVSVTNIQLYASPPAALPLSLITSCGASASCASPILFRMRNTTGTIAFSAATTATVTAMPTFSGTQTYTCYASDPTHTYTVAIQNVSATSFTITSDTSNSDTWNWGCQGY